MKHNTKKYWLIFGGVAGICLLLCFLWLTTSNVTNPEERSLGEQTKGLDDILQNYLPEDQEQRNEFNSTVDSIEGTVDY